ncbi:MAG: hypothetical protein EOO88_38960 [Pedobacter sp.]|nr:MAG: hypothetical protein EOO88_38960 [Pedobacter sp.]
MKQYYVNDTAQSNGDHEVHENTCIYFQSILKKTYLGSFTNCQEAVDKAGKLHKQVNGCAKCCKFCHTQ